MNCPDPHYHPDDLCLPDAGFYPVIAVTVVAAVFVTADVHHFNFAVFATK
ncbi:methyltransferase [Yersinia aldovae ATCC 35236]|nr:methyltransferase [Yersinia aldovae ATCC 35236]